MNVQHNSVTEEREQIHESNNQITLLKDEEIQTKYEDKTREYRRSDLVL